MIIDVSKLHMSSVRLIT